MAAVVVAAALAAPAAGAATWSPVNDATKVGEAFAPAAAADAGGRFTIGFVRHLGGRHRAEVRRGLLGGRLRGDSVVLDSSGEDLSSVALTQAADGLSPPRACAMRIALRARAPRPSARRATSAAR